MNKLFLLYELYNISTQEEKKIIQTLIDKQEKPFILTDKKYSNSEYKYANGLITRWYNMCFEKLKKYYGLYDDDCVEDYDVVEKKLSEIGLLNYYLRGHHWFFDTKEINVFQQIIIENRKKKESDLKTQNK